MHLPQVERGGSAQGTVRGRLPGNSVESTEPPGGDARRVDRTRARGILVSMTNDGTHGEAAPLRLPWRWLLPSAILSAATLIVGIVLYGWMPGRLPTRFGPGGWPEAWSDKSVGSVFGTVVIQVLVLVVIVLAGAANLRPRSGHTPRLALVQALFVLVAGVQLTPFLATLAVWT